MASREFFSRIIQMSCISYQDIQSSEAEPAQPSPGLAYIYVTAKLTGNKILKKMDEQRVMVLLYLVALSATFQQCFSFSTNDQLKKLENVTDGSSVILPISGNVYPKGYYQVTINVGDPPSPYFFDIDTGSDVTWLQCDAPCQKCFPAPHPIYHPSKDIVKCSDPYCKLFHFPDPLPCKDPQDQCDYDVKYADQDSSAGVLLRDLFSLKLTNGQTLNPRLAFGCGYHQEFANPTFTDGVIGLGKGKATIIAQLRTLGLVPNIFGHCFSSQEGGYLFIGDNILPSSGIVWAPMSSNPDEKHYSLGPAKLQINGQATGVAGLPVIFDSGATYTYFSSQDYGALLNVLKQIANKNKFTIANDDKTLPVCWKGTRAFKSVQDVKNLFIPLVLSSTISKNVQFQLSPEAYLIISDRGNVCLGIQNGADAGLEGQIVIGDISMQDQMVIYDNEKQQIGWVNADCNKLPEFS